MSVEAFLLRTVSSCPSSASPFGVLDMAGNVLEWVADWYDDYYSRSAYMNPTGPISGTDCKVVRSGSWGQKEWLLQAYSRICYTPESRGENFGFRCLRSP